MHICPKCERELRTPNQSHNCVKVNIGDLFQGKAGDLEFVFDRLLSEIVDWDHVSVSATKNCIVFVNKKTFLIVKPMKNQLDLKFYSDKEENEFPVVKSGVWNSKYENHIRVSTTDELTPAVYSYIKKSYELS
jgi:Domain of unknown function (DUF5655)